MDETSVCLWQGESKGTVLFRKRRDPPDAEPIQRANRRKRRTCLTHIAFVCDRPEVQPLLPQVIVGNLATFLAREFPGLQAASPENVELVRQKSAWNDAKLQARVVRKLGLVLRPLLHECQPILLMDAVPLHFSAPVIQACFAANIWPVIVPAKMTFLLQPCDTHVFQPYKFHLRAAVQAARLATAGGDLSLSQFLSCMYGAIRSVLQGHRWAVAFDKDGFGKGQSEVSVYVKRQLGLEGMHLQVPSICLTQGDLQLCFPKRAKVTIARFLRPAPARPDAPRWPVGFRLGFRVSSGHVRSLGAAVVPHARVLPFSRVPGAVGGREPRARAEHRLAAASAATELAPEGRSFVFCMVWWLLFGSAGWSGGSLLVGIWQVLAVLHLDCGEEAELTSAKQQASMYRAAPKA